jgi:RHS repeat-associated protein
MKLKVFAFTLLSFCSCNFLAAQTNSVPDNVELAVLRNIYDSLAGAGWTNKTNWPSLANWPASATSGQFGSWQGISVSNGDITSISLAGNNLIGQLPKSINQLTKLKTVFLGSNQISGPVPELGNLNQLQILYLNNNFFSGSIPTSLGSISSLLKLKLDNNALTGGIPSSIGSLSQLTELFLNNNQLSGEVPTSLGSLSNLLYCYIRNNQLSGSLPSSIGSLSKLQFLYASNNQLTGPLPNTVSQLSELLIFDVSNNQLSGLVPSVASWTKIAQINLSNNQFVGTIPEDIGNCVALTSLRCELNSFTKVPAGIVMLPLLVTFNAENNDINSIPDVSTQVNKANLTLQLRNNRLDFSQLELMVGRGIKTITYSPQKLLSEYTQFNISIGGNLVYPARSRGSNGTITWYFRPNANAVWGVVNSFNQDASQNTFTKNGMQFTDIGQIKYRITSSVVTGVTLESFPANISVGYDIAWKDLVGVTFNGNTILKTAATGWGNAGASSVNELPANTDGWIEFTSDGQACGSIIGFSDVNVDATQNTVDYGILSNGTSHQILQNGTPLGTYPHVSGDVFRIKRVGSTIEFYKNYVLEQSITNAITGLLFADAAINENSCKISNARTSFWIPAAQGSVPDIWEAYALKDIFQGMGGSTWTRKTSWPTTWAASYTAAQMDTWYGITVSGGDITRIELSSNNLTGPIPESIGNLSKLQIIRFHSNLITGSIPFSILKLKALTHLNLGINQMSGPIPSEIGTLTNINWLGLYTNAFSGTLPESIFSMPNLENLYLFSTDVSGTIPSTFNLPKIKLIYLNRNKLTGGIPPSIATLQPTLTSLALENNPTLGGAIPPEIGNLTKLTELWLNGNGHTGTIPTSIGNLTQLKILNLFDNSLEGTIPSSLKNLTNLEWTALSENKLSGTIPAFFGRMTKMDSLWLNDNQLTGGIPDSLKYATSLALLNVSRNKLSGKLPIWLGNLAFMTNLQLASNGFYGSIPDTWNSLTKLYHVDLSSTSIDGSLPEWLVAKTTLRKLIVNNSAFTSFPKFNTHANKQLLELRVERNRIPVSNIEENFQSANTHPFLLLSYGPQQDTEGVSSITLAPHDQLRIDAPQGGVHGTYFWEKLLNGTWTSINSNNQNSTQTSFIINDASAAVQGTYRYKVTNTWLNEILFESGPIEVKMIAAATIEDGLAFQYRYDKRKRLVRKKIPGADWIYMVYDNRDRLVLTQDGNQRISTPQEWTFTKYDAQDRPIMTGIFKEDNPSAPLEYPQGQMYMQQRVDDFYVAAASNTDEWFETRGLAVHGYTNQSFPKIADETAYYTITYYDDYVFKGLLNDPAFDFDPAQLPATSEHVSQESTFNSSIKGYVAGTKTKILTENTWLWCVQYYDQKYRKIQAIAQHHKGGRNVTTNVFDFSGQYLRSKTTTTTQEKSVSVTKIFSYDHAGRLINSWHQVDDLTTPADDNSVVHLSENKFNEVGELITQKIHSTDGEKFQQHVDYRYNIRGWLTHINDAGLENADEGPKDYFGIEYGYNAGLQVGTFDPRFDGTISASKWSANLGAPVSAAISQRAYIYTYDALGRLASADQAWKGITWTNTKSFAESVKYDLNGNVTHLKRTGDKGLVIDDLLYRYGPGKTNQIASITDYGMHDAGLLDGHYSGTDYEYDASGNIVKDANKGIRTFSYSSYLNMQQEITKENGETVRNVYDANGFKITQETFANGASTPSSRMDFIGQLSFKDGELSTVQHSFGKVVISEDTEVPEYQYQIKDNVDNVRLTFTSKQKTEEFIATMEDDGVQDVTNPRFQERELFGNIDETEIRNVNQWLNHTGNGVGGNAVYLDGSASRTIGPYNMMKVYPGDTLDIEVFAKFQLSSSYSPGSLPLLLASLASPVTGAAHSVDGGAGVTSSELMGNISSLLAGKANDPDLPGAYLNVIVFDKNFIPVAYESKQITSGAGFEETEEYSVEFDRLFIRSVIDQQGYVYTYLSNESAGSRVWMDDLTITYKQSPIIQFEDYYPFGLSIAETAFQRGNDNYNGSVSNEGTGLKDLGFRSYDPTSGRFQTVDPLAELQNNQTPYQYAGNNPVANEDELGLWPWGKKKNDDRKPKKKGERTHWFKGYSLVKKSRLKAFVKAVVKLFDGKSNPKKEVAKKDKADDKKDDPDKQDDPDMGGGKKSETSTADNKYSSGGLLRLHFSKGDFIPESQEHEVGIPRTKTMQSRRSSGAPGSVNHVWHRGHADAAAQSLAQNANLFSDRGDIILAWASDQASKDHGEATRELLFTLLPVKEALAVYYSAIHPDENDPVSQRIENGTQSSPALDTLQKSPTGHPVFDEFFRKAKEANIPGEDNQTPKQMPFETDDFNVGEIDYEGWSIVRTDSMTVVKKDDDGNKVYDTIAVKNRHPFQVNPKAAGDLNTDPEISFRKKPTLLEDEYEIVFSFTDKNSSNDTLLTITVNNTVSARAVQEELGLGPEKIDKLVEDIHEEILDEKVADKSPGQKANAIVGLVELCSSDEDNDHSFNTNDLQGLSDNEKVDLINIIFWYANGREYPFDDDDEMAVNKLIAGTKPENVHHLHEELQSREVSVHPPDGQTSEYRNVFYNIVDHMSDQGAYGKEPNDNFTLLMSILSKQVSEKGNHNSGLRATNENNEDLQKNEPVYYEGWTGTEDHVDPDGRIWHFESEFKKDGTLTVEKAYDDGEVKPYAEYDQLLTDLVQITPASSDEGDDSAIGKISNGNPMVGPAALVGYAVEHEENEDFKWKTRLAVNISTAAIGGAYLKTASGALFYLGLAEVSAATLNIGLDVFDEELRNTLGDETVDNVKTFATLTEIGTNLGAMWKAPELIAELTTKADNLLAVSNQFDNLKGANKLLGLEAVEGAKQLKIGAGSTNLATTGDLVNDVKNSSSQFDNLLDQTFDNAKFANSDGSELSVFVRKEATATEVITITKQGDNFVPKLADDEIITKVGAQNSDALAQGMVDNPDLAKAIGNNKDLATNYKNLGASGVVNLRNDADFLKTNSKYYSTGDDKLTRQYESAGVTVEEETAIRHYTGNSYRELNATLESGQTTPKVTEYKNLLNSGLSKLPNQTGDVYRGLDKAKSDIAKNWTEGQRIDDPTFVSSSLSDEVAVDFMTVGGGDVVLVIESKTGKLIQASSQSPHEVEVLFQSNKSFEVVKKYSNMTNDGRIYTEILLKEL